MKKVLGLTLIGLAIFTIEANSKNIFTKEIRLVKQQDNDVKGYIYQGGNFISGTVVFRMNQQGGYTPIRYNGFGLQSGNFLPDSRFKRLNPNNPMAVKYNFTHFVQLPYGQTVYVSLD